MCLVVKKKFKDLKDAKAYKPLIATKDIKVYKILDLLTDVGGKAPYRGFRYQKGFQYTESKLELCYDLFNSKYEINVDQGLHAYVKRDCPEIRNYLSSYYSNNESGVVEMIIPKGSIYYLGTNNDIVTNNLIWY